MIWLDRSGLGDDPPALFIIFLALPMILFLNLYVLSHLTQNAFEFAEPFQRQEVQALFSSEF